MATLSETDHAHFTRLALDLLVVRLKPGLLFGVDQVADIMRERVRLCGKDPLCVLFMVPPDAELDVAVIGMDHYQANNSDAGLCAVAIVSDALVMQTMARLYAAYFPPRFMLEVFHSESEARAWLDVRLAVLREAGQKA